MTRIGDPKAGCEFTPTPGGMMVSCTRRSTRATCAYCKHRPAEYTCDFPYRGPKAGQTCNGRLCAECAYAAPGTSMHLCPQHRRLLEREVSEERAAAQRVDAWLDSITKDETAAQDAAVVCTCSTSPKWPHYGDPRCPEHKVDRKLVDAMFPDWAKDFGDDSPVNAIAGEIRARGVVKVDDPDERAEDLRRTMSSWLDTHDFEGGGDICMRCGVQAMPDGTIEGSCPDILALQEEHRLTQARIDAQRAADRLLAKVPAVDPNDERIVREFADDLARRRVDDERIVFAFRAVLDTPGFAVELARRVNEHGCLPCHACGGERRDVVAVTVDGSRSIIRCPCGMIRPVVGTVDGETRGTGVDVHVDPVDMQRIVDGNIAAHLHEGRRAGKDAPEPKLSLEEIERRLRAQLDRPGVAPSNVATSSTTKDPAVMDPATTADKVRHVKSARQTREHGCHWPGCKVQVPPAKWGCTAHWYMLPKPIRDKIWRAYRPGQEETLTPSREYIEATREAIAWAAEWNAANSSTEKPRPTWEQTTRKTRERDSRRPK